MTSSVSSFENIPADETQDTMVLAAKQAAVHQMMLDLDKKLSRKDVFGNAAAAPRAQHRKNHGALWANFVVESNDALPETARVGLFAKPGTYKAVIRFSNGKELDDTKNDAHGMAVKVLIPAQQSFTGESQSQDFIMIDHPVFLARNVKHFLGMFSLQLEAIKLERQLDEAIKTNQHDQVASLKEELGKTRKTLATEYPIIAAMLKQPGISPLHMRYWSQSPYLLGSQHAVKFLAIPSNHLRETMIALMSSEKPNWTFDFCVQFFVNESETPIEDPTVEWKCQPIKVATISIAPQDFHTEEQMQFCEDLTFNPWQGLPEHAPLGGINRARQKIYAASSHLRHIANGRPEVEPVVYPK